jgi:hypothetical protein
MDIVTHTPGPWHVGPHYKSDVESREGRICECRPLSSPRAEANARLVAAAPDLLIACEKFVASFKSLQREKCDVAHRLAVEAIAKATQG